MTIIKNVPAHRNISVDILRGMAVFAMILVNNPGNWDYVYVPLQHAVWNGWTPTDVIFPAFIFIVGVSVSLSLGKGVTPDLKLHRRIIDRSVKLFGLGLLIAVFYHNFSTANQFWLSEELKDIRIMGVLQRIAVVYFFVALLVLHCRPMTWLITAIGLATAYWLMINYAPYSIFGVDATGSFSHGNSFAAYLDQSILGREHTYYQTAIPLAYDPEGILSTLTAISTGLLGALAGHYWYDKRPESTLFLALAGAALAGAGLFLDSYIPINKTMWTPSFVLLTAGITMMISSLVIFIVEQCQLKAWSAVFVVCGSNAMAFYAINALVALLAIRITVGDTTLQGAMFEQLQTLFGSYNGSLAFAIIMLMVCYLPVYWMFKRSWFWRV